MVTGAITGRGGGAVVDVAPKTHREIHVGGVSPGEGDGYLVYHLIVYHSFFFNCAPPRNLEDMKWWLKRFKGACACKGEGG